MVGVTTTRLEPLADRTPALFLVAGVLLTGYAVLNGVAAFTETAYLLVEDVVGPAGFVAGFLGLLGLYPSLADRSPGLARVGAVCAALGAVGFAVVTAMGVGTLAGVVSESTPGWFPLLLGVVAVGMLGGYLSFGAASLRTGGSPRPLGFLLLAPALVFGVMLTSGAAGYTPYWAEFAISGGQALAYLAITGTLRRRPTATDHEVRPGDVTTG